MKLIHSFYSLLTLALLITACTPKNQEKELTTFSQPNAKYKHYVSAYTSGMVSKTDAIRLRFANDVVDYDQVGTEVPEGVITFEPALKAKLIWEDRQTIKVVPNEWLPAGQFYSAKADLSVIYPDIDQELATLSFDFKTLEQAYDVEIYGLRENTLTDFTSMKLVGMLKTTDAAMSNQVEQMLKVEQAGNIDFEIEWTHTNNKKEHQFIISDIKTNEEESELFLHWKGKPIGIEQDKIDTIMVPSTEFQIVSTKVIRPSEDATPYISVLFSQPLEQVQNLEGLINIENYRNRDYYGNSNFRYVIDGNELQVYPTKGIEGGRAMTISAGIRSINKTAIPKPSEWDITFETLNPQVRLVGDGVIVPSSKGLYFPFEAVKLKGVDVEIFKIYEDNVLQFLQGSELSQGNDYAIRYVGRIVAQKHIELQHLEKESNSFGWKRYTLKLDDLIQKEEGAIYQVRLGFSKEDATCDCIDQSSNLVKVDNEAERDGNGEIRSIYDTRSYYYYDYNNRDNPCHEAYYNNRRFVRRNILGSNIGIIAKRGKNKELFVAVTNLLTAEPIENATVEVYDKVLQRLSKLVTNKDGIIKTETDFRPHFVVVSDNKQKGYLRLQGAESVSLSAFKTSGTSSQEGLKGKIYGERGVWRPGDSLYLTFVLEDKRNAFPDEHPVTFSLIDPRGKIHAKYTTNQQVKGMYDFRCSTADNAPTGYWQAKVEVGGTSFYKRVRIETVKPNRLKIDLDLGKDKLLASDKILGGDLAVNWLHGAPANGVRTTVDVNLRSVSTSFEDYKAYDFDDPARATYYGSPFTLYDSKVDENGKAKVRGHLELAKQPSGFMRAAFTVRAYEKGGDVSTDNFSIPYSPYHSYVGIQSPKGKDDRSLDLNVNNKIKIVVVDEKGQAVANRKVRIGVYKLKRNWWYDSDKSISSFNSSEHIGATRTASVTTNSKGEAVWDYKPTERGRYMIRLSDTESKHCSGMVFHLGSPWHDPNFNDKKSSAMLAFSADKEEYQVGDKVQLNIPAGKKGYALLTLENGFGVTDYKWIKIDNKEGIQTVSFETTAEMAPTIYAHVTLLQPHEAVENDLPLRSYGVIPIKVVDPATKLEPVLDMADVLSPNSKVKVTVSEENNQPMAYTIAMVDEGLLDLTRFQTPDLWEHFYQKEALGVGTWDLYNYVMSSFSLERILTIGGGAGGDKDGKKANRFKPVVRFAGPFYLKAGQKASHTLEMPNYIGSVRTMVVAADAGAYGKTEKTMPVREPLMVLGSLPRMLSPTEKVKLPVTVFAMEDHVKQVSVSIEANEHLKIVGPSKQQLTFDKLGERILEFDLEVAKKLGIAKVKITAESGKEKATYEVELDVRNPNPYNTKVLDAIVEAGNGWSVDVAPIGMEGTNEAVLEVSHIPPIDLSKRLSYLIRYPYGCIEQTTSSVFPQLVLNNLIQLSPLEEAKVEQNIRAAVRRLQDFQTGLGGFAYWAGGNDASNWGTNYAGHFLLEAKAKGYKVPKGLLDNWKRYQKSIAKTWRAKQTLSTNQSYYRSKNRQSALMQAYRLYTLALAGDPDLGAMNRMRNTKGITATAKWRLAAAYALAGKRNAANKLIKGLTTTVSPYLELSYTYGSDLRDEAMILETLVLLDKRKEAMDLLTEMADKLSSPKWYATQTLAYSLLAVAKFVGDKPLEEEVPFAYTIGNKGTKEAMLKKRPIAQYDFDVEASSQRKVSIKNKSKSPLFARVVLQGQPLIGDSKTTASNLKLSITYKDMEGNKIDPTSLEQGTSFMALVEVQNTATRGTYEEMALHQVFPSGWEIVNSRMNGAFASTRGSARIDYQDIRDDRIYTYFDIYQGKTNTYKFYLTAAYQGKFYMPNVVCKAMYDNSIFANTAGKWVQVVPREERVQ